jgi:hypothetical protein
MQEQSDRLRIALNAGVLLFFLIAIGSLYWQVERMQTDIVDLRQSIITEVKKIAETATQAASNSRRAPAAAEPNRKILDSLKEELSAAKRQATAAALAAKTEAVKHADQLAEQIGQERQSQHKEIVGELGQIKKTEATTSAKIGDVSNDIVNIKSEVASTRQELQETVSELKRVTGDLGVQSGYIATNAKELQALRMLNERNYFEFHIERTGKPQKVGDVSMILRKTDPKRNKYTLDVLAGDKKTEKKEKSINEPVQFYISKARHPFEIVVNEVQKDYIIGYLSVPRERTTRVSGQSPLPQLRTEVSPVPAATPPLAKPIEETPNVIVVKPAMPKK